MSIFTSFNCKKINNCGTKTEDVPVEIETGFQKEKEDLNQSEMYQKSSLFEFGSKLALRIFISFSEEIMFNSDLQQAEIVYRKKFVAHGIFEANKWDNPMIRVMGYILLIHMSIYEYEL